MYQILATCHQEISKLGNATSLYDLLRAWDKDGRGNLIAPINSTATLLGVKPKTVVKWLKNNTVGQKPDAGCFNLSLFRSVTRVGRNEYEVYLNSLVNVCLANHVTDLGACALVPIHRLKARVATLTDITMLSLQSAAGYGAYKEAPASKKKLTIDPEELLSYPCSNSQRERAIEVTKYRIYVDDFAVVFGGSHRKAALILGVTPQTISNRLSVRYRSGDKRRMKPVNKKQVIQRTIIPSVQMNELAPLMFPKLFLRNGSVYEYKCNIYSFEDISLTSARAKRHFLKRALKEREEAGMRS